VRIVVGVSPTSGSPNALRWGAEEATLRGLPLLAVMAWRPPRPPAAPGGRPPATLASTAVANYGQDAMGTLLGFVDDALGSEVTVECQVVKGNAANALLSASGDAQLLVLGEPRSGRLGAVKTSLLAPHLVLKAPCPVVVLPAAAT
jgi:nucleotide-binding universal stress UspA family protein